MSRKIRSIKGEIVDFDLFDIKKQMANAAVSIDVNQREKFIDKKRRRVIKKSIDNMIHNQPIAQVSEVVQDTVIEVKQSPVVESAPVQIIKK